MRPSPALRALFPVICLTMLAFLPSAAIAQQAGVGLSQRALCYTFSILGGNVGLLIGFSVAIFGLWTIIRGNTKSGVLLILGGALVPATPSLVSASLSGLQGVLKSSGISASGVADAGSVMSSMGGMKDNCEAIPVDMSAYEREQQVRAMNGANPGSSVVANPDGTFTVTNADGSKATVASPEDAMKYLGQSVGSGQCVDLVKAQDPSIGATSGWAPGQQVLGGNLAPGTLIATFECGGGTTYCNQSGSSHAAILMGYDKAGNPIVEDQWLGQPAHIRTLYPGAPKDNDATKYRAITRK